MSKVWIGGTKPTYVHLDTETYGALVMSCNEAETLINELREAVTQARRANTPPKKFYDK